MHDRPKDRQFISPPVRLRISQIAGEIPPLQPKVAMPPMVARE
jgi:hypothetical protein